MPSSNGVGSGGSRRHSHTPDAGGAAGLGLGLGLGLGVERDRRHSTSSSSDASGGDAAQTTRQYSNENIEYLPARLAKVTTSKPAANPLQFVKVRPCDLYRSAQEQIRKVEQVKKMKAEVRDEAEDWQSNLDNWKSSRRKRQEHIIERVVEVKKLETEEQERARRRSKTFSEILEERRGRKLSLPMYQEEDTHDLSDLGIGGGDGQRPRNGDADAGAGANSNNNSNGNNSGSGSEAGDAPASPAATALVADSQNGHPESASGAAAKGDDEGEAVGAGAVKGEEADKAGEEEKEEAQEEYTYERAIQSYVDFAETRVRNGHAKRPASLASLAAAAPSVPQPQPQPLAAAPKPAAALPNVDVGKRRELFEKQSPPPPPPPRRPPAAAESVRQRLHALQQQQRAPPPPPPKPRASATALAVGKAAEPAEPAGIAGLGLRAQLHRSLDSLQVAPAPCEPGRLLSEAFERVQSLQAVDRCGEVEEAVDGDGDEREDREDSGIHTADASCSVSQADEPVDEAPAPEDDDEAEEDEQRVEEEEEGAGVTEETVTTVGSEVPASPPLTPLTPLSALSPTPPPSPTPTPAAAEEEDQGEESKREDEQGADEEEQEPPIVPNATCSSAAVAPAPAAEEPALPPPVRQAEAGAEAEVTEVEAVVPAPAPAPAPALPLPLPPPLDLGSGEVAAIVGGLAFPLPLGPPTAAEPPKEKPPPPPPLETSDEEGDAERQGDMLPVSPLRRLDSTKRIKKEIRRKRSDFLGLEGGDGGGGGGGAGGEGDEEERALALSLALAPPPDLASLLAEERRVQRELFRRSLASSSDADVDVDADADADAAESRDSGVELERGGANDQDQAADAASASPQTHSRTNSEIFGHSLTSEEEEMSRREKEIIASLEQEEQWRHGDSIGEQLAERLRVLELEKAEMERRRMEEDGFRREEERRLAAREAALRLHENTDDSLEPQETLEESPDPGEALQREQARLDAQREQLRELESPVVPMQQPPPPQHRWSAGPTLQSYTSRQSEMAPTPMRRPPPPAPPVKPQRMASQEQLERDNSIRSSRVPSADFLAESNRGNLLASHSQAMQQAVQPHQMSRQTLQALSAAPRSRLITNDTWIQARRKTEPTRPGLNTQHWLIQEAEHRRLTEQAQRCAPPPRRPPLPQQQWAHHQPPPPPPPPRPEAKPLPDSIIQTLTQRVQGRTGLVEKKKVTGVNMSPNRDQTAPAKQFPVSNNTANNAPAPTVNGESQEKMLSVSGKKKCSHCGEELGRGAAMIIESLRLFYHIDCFKCCVCHVQLGDGLMGTDVRVRNSKLHCHNCYSSEDGVKFSCV